MPWIFAGAPRRSACSRRQRQTRASWFLIGFAGVVGAIDCLVLLL